MVEFGEQLKRAREDKGLTQQSLAEQLYVTRQSVSHWECGDRYPDLITTKKISELLDVSLDDLLSGKDMTKVIERNPVIENKTANNCIIACYAFIVLSKIIQLIGSFYAAILVGDFFTYAKEYPFGAMISLEEILKLSLIIAIFSYGLISAIKENLSPKRAGKIITFYFALLFVCELIFDICLFSSWQFPAETLKLNYLGWIIALLQAAIGAISTYLFFVRKSNKKIWSVLLLIVSSLKIIGAIYNGILSIFSIQPGTSPLHNSVTSIAVDTLPPLLIYGVIIFQAIALYRKRRVNEIY